MQCAQNESYRGFLQRFVVVHKERNEIDFSLHLEYKTSRYIFSFESNFTRY